MGEETQKKNRESFIKIDRYDKIERGRRGETKRKLREVNRNR